MSKLKKHNIAVIWLGLSLSFGLSQAMAGSLTIFPGETVLLPLPEANGKRTAVVCHINNMSYPSSVEVLVRNTEQPKQTVYASINGNQLMDNQGHLTRRENQFVFLPEREQAPLSLTNTDFDVAIQVKSCDWLSPRSTP